MEEILQQGRSVEAATTAAWKKMETETAAHQQGIISVYDRTTEVQKPPAHESLSTDSLAHSPTVRIEC